MALTSKGFTLLELLVVLVILGLSAAVATPALIKLVDSLNNENRRDQARLYMQSLPLEAMRRGEPRQLTATQGYSPLREALGPEAAAAMGEDFRQARVWIPEGIRYQPNGACTGGATHWELPGGLRFTLAVEPPQCRPRLES